LQLQYAKGVAAKLAGDDCQVRGPLSDRYSGNSSSEGAGAVKVNSMNGEVQLPGEPAVKVACDRSAA
jgi:hypothetical protein